MPTHYNIQSLPKLSKTWPSSKYGKHFRELANKSDQIRIYCVRWRFLARFSKTWCTSAEVTGFDKSNDSCMNKMISPLNSLFQSRNKDKYNCTSKQRNIKGINLKCLRQITYGSTSRNHLSMGIFFIDFHHSYTENQDYVQDFPAKCDGYSKEGGFIEGMKGGDSKAIFRFYWKCLKIIKGWKV